MSNTTFKGIPLAMWKSEKLLDRLSENELLELHTLMSCELLDMIEPIVQRSPMVEAMLVITKASRDGN